MAFNVFARNRDDHSKNHAFRMDASGAGSPTPAYDLTFSIGPGGEHNMAISGEGRTPGRGHILEEARMASIKESAAAGIIDEVREAVDPWPRFAEEAGLSQRRTAELDFVLNDRGVPPKDDVKATAES